MNDHPRCSVNIAECRDGGSLATWRATNRDGLYACDRHRRQFGRCDYDSYGVAPPEWERLGGDDS